MGPDLVRRRRALDDIHDRFEHRPNAAPLDPALRDSWVRCAPTLPANLDAVPLDEHELEERWDASPIRRAAPDLSQQMESAALDGDFVAAITDADGRILWSSGGRSMRRRAEQVNFVAGGRWDESSAGTNALALALIGREPATVFSAEHWCAAVHDWVCYSAPVRSRDGSVIGVIDLSTTWRRATALGLPMVTSMARLVELALPEERGLPEPRLLLDLLGPGRGRVRLDGMTLPMTPRQVEILAILAGSDGLDVDALQARLYGDRWISTTTLKSEISHLRRTLGIDAIASRPYRLAMSHRADFLTLLDRLERGDLAGAVDLYSGSLLPASDSPFVVEQRHVVDVALRNALLRRGTARQLLRFAEANPFDVEVLSAAVDRASAADPSAALATARRSSSRSG